MTLADTLLWLCKVRSPIGEERELCDLIGARLERLGPAEPIRRYGDSIVVPLTRSSSARHVALAGHLDVVRTEHDGEPRIEGDRLYGPGASDMKSGLALMLDLAERVLAPGYRRPVPNLTLVFYAREEGPYDENELGDVLAQDSDLRGVDVAVALEPSDNKLQLGCGGSVHATVRFHGRTAHSARPWQGENAIHKASALLSRLGSSKPETTLVDGLEWRSVMSATLAEGGRARNVVPDIFELNVNRRFDPSESIEVAKERIVALVAGEAEVEFEDLSPAAPPFRRHPMVEALADSGVLAIEPKQAWTDVARFAQAGIVAVNFGPGVQSQAHQRNEWTTISQLDTGRAILERWVERIA